VPWLTTDEKKFFRNNEDRSSHRHITISRLLYIVMVEKEYFNKKDDCFRQIAIKVRVTLDVRSWRQPSLSITLITFGLLLLLLASNFLVTQFRFVNNNYWDGLAEIGPASTPSAWQATKPEILLMSYPGWSGIFSASQAQGPVLGTPADFSPRIQQSLVNLIKDTPSLRVVIFHGIFPGSILFARKLRLQIPSIRFFCLPRHHITAISC